jgi:hypothetical protein
MATAQASSCLRSAWFTIASGDAQPRLVQGAATGLEFSAGTADGIPRYGIIARRGGNNDLLSTLWQEVISLTDVARSFSSGGG